MQKLVIWGVSLAIASQPFQALQLLGFAVVVTRMCVYNFLKFQDKPESTKLVFKKTPGNSRDHKFFVLNFRKKKNNVKNVALRGPQGIVAGTLGIGEC